MDGSGSASHVLAPAFATVRELRDRLDSISGDSKVAHELERQALAVAQMCNDPAEISRQSREGRSAGEYLDRLLHPMEEVKSAYTIFQQGKHAEGQFQYRKALELYLHALDLESDNLATINAAGRTAFWLGEIKRAVELFYAAPKSSLDTSKADLRASFLSNYAGALRSQGELMKAERILKHALSEAANSIPPIPDQLSMILNNLGAMQSSRADFADAEDSFRRAIEVRADPRSLNDLGLAQIHNNYAELKRKTGAIRDAKDLHRRALNARLAVLGPVSLAVSESYNNLGALAQDEECFSVAERCLRSALEITEQILGRRHFQYGVALNNFGMYLYKRRHFEEALVYLSRAEGIVQHSAIGSSDMATAIEKNVMLVEVAAASNRATGNVIRDAIIIGPVNQSIATVAEEGKTLRRVGTKSGQKVSNSSIIGKVRMSSDVAADQEFVGSSASSLEMIIKTKRGREQLKKELEHVAEEGQKSGVATPEEAKVLREAAADLTRKGGIQQALGKLGAASERLIGFAEKIGASVAAKAIEHSLGL